MEGPSTIPSTKASAPTRKLDDQQKARLQKAVKDFEAMLVGYMLKSMRSSSNESEMFGDSFGGDVLEGMFDSEMARHVSRSSDFGLADMLYRQVTGEALPKGPMPAVAKSQGRSSEAGGQPMLPRSNSVGGQKITTDAGTPVRTLTPALKKMPSVAPQGQDHKKVQSSPTATSVRVPSRKVQARIDALSSLVDEASATNGVDSSLIKAVIAAESAGKPTARSSSDAKGLMQLIDSTAANLGVRNVWNPKENILAGSKYLRQLLDKFDGDTTRAVASYNAGPAAVDKHNGVPPFKETQEYVGRVMGYWQYFQQQDAYADDRNE